MKKIIISLLIILPLLFVVSAYAVEEGGITVYMTVEKLTLGQGFIVEPMAVQTTEGASVAEVLEQVLPGQYMHTGTVEDNLYVSAFEDAESEVNIPDYLAEIIGEITTRQDSGLLSEFDYSDTSGWKFSVNNEFPSISASDINLQDGNVIRWQFSLYGYGADLGMGSLDMEGVGELADKSELIRYIADAKSGNSDLIADQAYAWAMEALSRIDSDQNEINAVYDELSVAEFYAVESGYSGANLNLTADYVKATVIKPQIAQVGGEWTILGLARSGIDINKSYFDEYYDRVVKFVRENGGVLHKRKYTEYSRVIPALAAIGKNPTNVSGYNLLTPLTDFDAVMKQGINGAIFALLALDCVDYKTDIREKYVSEILSRQRENGAFSLAENGTEEIDVTAMALCALSNYTDNNDVNNAVERALQYISEVQESDGGFSVEGEKTSESAVQVIVALTSLGISPDDERFVKNGSSVLDNLLSFAKENGGFSHAIGTDADLMATEQALYALAAVERFNAQKSSLYDMADVDMAECTGPERVVSGYERIKQKTLDLAKLL